MIWSAVMLALFGLTIASKSESDYHSIELPIKSKHELEVIKTPSEESSYETYVDVPGGVLPVYITFKTKSSPLYVKQEHKGTKGSYQKSDSEDEPHKLYHEVIKPVYHELKEVIMPYRKVVQVIEGVKEERLTKVHKGERKNNNYDKSYEKAYEKSANDNSVKKYMDEVDNKYLADYQKTYMQSYKD